MHRLVPLCCAAALVGCAPSTDQRVDTAAAADAGRPVALADVAGRWRVRALSTRGDSLTTYEMVSTADTTGWTLTFSNRPAMPLRVVAVDGDSVVTEVGPYPSVLRQTVPVKLLRSVTHFDGSRMSGTFIAHYETDRPDSVLYGRLEGSRVP